MQRSNISVHFAAVKKKTTFFSRKILTFLGKLKKKKQCGLVLQFKSHFVTLEM